MTPRKLHVSLTRILRLATFCTCCAITTLTASATGSSPNDSIITKLDDVLKRRDTYYVTREYRIDSLKNVMKTIPDESLKERTGALHDIFKEYSSFQGDSALNYARREYDMAQKTGDPDLIADAKSDLIFTYMSGGSFTDAVDIVNRMDLSQVSDSRKVEFYSLCIRLFSDLSNYSVADFSDKYARKSGQYCDSVMAIADPNSYHFQYAMAFSPKKNLNIKQKIATFRRLLNRTDLDSGLKAMLASILGDFYLQAGDQDNYMYYKTQSAILDVMSAKRETVSKLDLGRIMFERGDVERAYRYIDLAKEDADFYNARNRKFQIMSILPIVEKARYSAVDHDRHSLLIVAIVMIALLILLGGGVFFFVRQLREVRKARKELEERNDIIEKKNEELNSLINQVRESNRIKDEYIGYGFNVHAEYIRKIESLYNVIDRKLMAKQYDDLRKFLKKGDIRKEKENMHEEFDRIFLRLFPDFVNRYKALFPPDDPKNAECNGRSLTSEMRIFALIRLGISDISNIALFLNYSVNTVNTYKTKAKNRALVPNEEFEQEIMKIKST